MLMFLQTRHSCLILENFVFVAIFFPLKSDKIIQCLNLFQFKNELLLLQKVTTIDTICIFLLLYIANHYSTISAATIL